MRQFNEYTLSTFIVTYNKDLFHKIKAMISACDACFIADTPISANFCIVDAHEYLQASYYYDSHFDACLKLLKPQDFDQIDQILSHEFSFYLREDFVPAELIYKLRLIREHLANKHQTQILKTIYNAAQNSIVITNLKGEIEFANTYFLEATGYHSDEVFGNLPTLIKSNLHDASFYKELWATIQSGETWNGFFVNRRKDGLFFYEEATISPIFNAFKQITQYIKIGKLVNRERLLSDELSQEIRVAKDIIAYMLPPDYQNHHLHFQSNAKAYNYLGGDFICFERISDNRYALALLDVMGHGASSTLIGLKAISIFQSTIYDHSLPTAVSKMNDSVCQINLSDISSVRYLSGVFMEVDLSEKKISYINAGHPSFYIKKKKQLKAISSNNPIVGIKKHSSYIVDSFSAQDVDYIFLYSDGLIEQADKDIDLATAKLENTLLTNTHESDYFIHHILNRMLEEKDIEDDITLCRLAFNY